MFLLRNMRITRCLNLAALMMILFLPSGSAKAMTFAEFTKTCPLCNTQFKASLAVSGTQTGIRLDFKPLGFIAAPAPLAVCPKCRFVLFPSDLKDTDLIKLKDYVQTAEYRAWSKNRKSYFLLARLLATLGADDITLALTYLKASWEEEDNESYLQEDLKLSLFHIEAYLEGLPPDLENRIKKDDQLLNVYQAGQFLKGELLRRMKRFADAKAHFEAIYQQKIFQNSSQGNLITIEIKLCDSKDPTPHKVPDSFAVAVRDINNKAVKKLRLKITSSDYSNMPTSDSGLAHIMMPDDFQPGKIIRLKIEPPNTSFNDWFFITPWDGWLETPKAEEYVDLVLARRGDREILKINKAVRAMTIGILAMVNRQTIGPLLQLGKKDYQKILKEQAERFGFQPQEIDQAIYNWTKRTKDPYEIGLTALYNRNYSLAVEKFTEYLDSRTRQNGGFQKDLAEATYFLGWSLDGQGKHKEAIKSYLDSYKHRDLLKNPHPSDALLLNALGLSYRALGQWTTALMHYQRAIETNITLGDRRGESDQLGNFGLVYFEFGKTEQMNYAFGAFEKGLKICKEIGDDQCEANQLANMAIAYKKMGDTKRAADCFDRASKIRNTGSLTD